MAQYANIISKQRYHWGKRVCMNFTLIEPEEESVDLISKNVNVSELFSIIFSVFLPLSQG